MPGPDPAVAAVRRAVRTALAALPAPARDAPLLVALSGGADSTALLAAARHVAPGRVHVAVVDHGLQEGSAERSAALVAALAAQGVPAAVHAVTVDGPGGIEAAARRARYAALRAARPHPDSAVLLGHTLDDQAETVLLGLGRGSGARSLAGMTAWDPPWLRPLLSLRRTDTRAACRAQGLPVWDDPHNADPRFTRVRLRHEVLPLLEEVLGGGVAAALARTAAQLRDDGAALDADAAALLARAARPDGTGYAPGDAQRTRPPAERAGQGGQPAEQGRGTRRAETADSPSTNCGLAEHELRTRRARTADSPDENCGLAGAGAADGGVLDAGVLDAGGLDAGVLAAAPAAVRRRALRRWLAGRGVTGLTDEHLRAADDLIGRWRGQGAVALPQRLELIRGRGRLRLRTAAWPDAHRPTPSRQEGPPCTTGTSRPC